MMVYNAQKASVSAFYIRARMQICKQMIVIYSWECQKLVSRQGTWNIVQQFDTSVIQCKTAEK